MDVLKFEEAEPSVYPDLIAFDGEGEALDPVTPDRALWQRIEAYIAHRWTPRQCVWTVEGPGVWLPHLSPVSNASVDGWDDTTFTWSSADPSPTPLGGFVFYGCRTYRITTTVGDTVLPVPQPVIEAYMRLYDYAAEACAVPAGANSYGLKIGDGLDETIARSPNWLARAMQQSGAGDLLRGYRRI
jgi:hypothetical protein